MRRCAALGAVLTMIGGMAGYVALSATAAGATTTTVIVGAGDQAGIKNTTPQQEWAFQDTNTHSGTVGWVAGPTGQPLGAGSLAMGMTEGQHEWLVTNQFGPCATGFPTCNATPVNLADITALSYQTYRTGGGQMPTLNIEVTPPGDGNGYTTFVYVPDPTQYHDTVWQNWDAYTDNTPRWYSTHQVTSPSGKVFDCASQSAGCYSTFAQIKTDYPDAKVIDGMGPNIGTGGTFQGNVDDMVVGVSGNNTVFDFEPDCTTTCYVNAATGSDFNTGNANDPVATIQAAVNKVSAGGTVNVAAGTYNESVTIPRGMTLNGANAGTAGAASRAPESTVSWSGVSGSVFNVTTADPVTINGFHPTFNGGQHTGGLLLSLQGNNHLTFTNNLVNNSAYFDALIFDDSAATSVVTNNKFDSIAQSGSPGSCVVCPWGTVGSNQAAVTITGNTFSNLTDTDGVPAINLSQVSGTVSGNTFSNIHQYGILLADTLGPLSITTNSFTNIQNDTPLMSSNRGSGIRTFQNPTFVGTGVDINHNTFSGDYNGVRVANDGPAATLSNLFKVNRNSFSGDTNEGISVASGTLGTSLEGTCNWWGSASGPSEAGSGSGDKVSSGVTFANWLTSSNLNSTCGSSVSIGTIPPMAEGSSGLYIQYVPVNLSSPLPNNVSVQYTTTKGTASTADFVKSAGTLTIPAGQTQGLIAVTIKGDTTPEKNESFTVNLSNAVGATLGASSTTITLLNDDLKATAHGGSAIEGGSIPFTLTIKYPMATATSVTFCTTAGTATSPADYSYSACPTTQTIVVPSQSLTATALVPTNLDGVKEGGETFTMRVRVTGTAFDSTVTGTIKGNKT
jgi:hypothetical protein